MEGWQKHIRDESRLDCEGKAWCGAELTQLDWAFLGIDHAIGSARQGNRLQPCPACVAAIVKALTGEASP